VSETASRRDGEPAKGTAASVASPAVRSFKDLRVFHAAMDAAMRIFELSRAFPREERFSLTDQLRRSSRAVCANIAESWSKRRYPAHFASKLSDAHAEAEETRVWLDFAQRCGYLPPLVAAGLDDAYDKISGQLVLMLTRPAQWQVKP
jgi:four helix bundle protein